MNSRWKLLASVLVASVAWLSAPALANAACVGGSPDGVYAPEPLPGSETGEECDDGNNINGDGCENDCTVTPFFECSLAVPFDALTTLSYAGAANDANWTPGTYSRLQDRNTTAPTFAYFGIDAADISERNVTLGLRVEQSNWSNGLGNPARADDDFIGFALGFNPDMIDDDNNRYLLIDWKAATQSEASAATRGMALSIVNGVPPLRITQSGNGQYGLHSDFWQKKEGTNYPDS